MTSQSLLPKAFFWRRAHSLAGLWLVAYLIMHLFTNSQAALFFGDDGQGFIHAVNSIHTLPYLPIIELTALAIPIAIHGIYGIKYLRTAAYNSFATDGSKPSLGEYPRNRAYTWQRITSWILLFAIVAHVIHMRFIEYPVGTAQGTQRYYLVRLDEDNGLASVAHRLGVSLYDSTAIANLKQTQQSEENWIEALEKQPLKPGQVIAASKDFGTAELLMVRETFKMPLMMLLYTLFVITACYHAFNGLWTFMISWGITPPVSQKMMLRFCTGLMILVTFLGLAAVWGTYWINLRN